MNDPNNIFGKKIESTVAELLLQLEPGIGEGFLSEQEDGGKSIRNIFGRSAHCRYGTDLSFLAGMAIGGLRTAAFLTGDQLGANYNQLAELARQNLGTLIHYTTYGGNGKGGSSGYGDFSGIAKNGYFQLQPSNLQELIDFTIIGHKVAELALLPGLCTVSDAYKLQEAVVPEAGFVRAFLGGPDEHINCPTPAQRLLFGKSRRRLPQWYNLDTPALLNIRKEQMSASLEGAAQELYFFYHLPEIIREVMPEYSRLSGRQYSPVKAMDAERADYLILVQGTAFETAVEAARQARNQEKIKVGCLSLSLLQPFPQEELAQWLAGKKGVAILEEVGSSKIETSAFFLEVSAAAQRLGRKAPQLYSGTFAGPLSQPAALAAIKNMQRSGAQLQRFFIGFDFTRPTSSYPQQQILLQSISREYPDIEKATLKIPAQMPEREKPGGAVRSLPFAIRRYQDKGPPYSRLSRFYQNTACFYQEGFKAELVADPYQAIPLVPAATANFAIPVEALPSLPIYQPQNCTGCGACIAYCPHSAMPGIAISLQSLIRSGMKIATGQGTPIPQLMGIERKLVKVAEELIKKNEAKVDRVDDFLPKAFQLLAEQSQMEGEKLERAQQGITILNDIIGHFPIAVTEPFFHQKERQEKGTTQFFSIAIDPNACTSCGLCVEVCEDDALHLTELEKDGVQQLEKAMELWEQLPDTPADTVNQLIQEPNYDPLAATLLSRHFYLSLSGGSTSEAGASAKTVTHWLTAVLESIRQPRVAEQAKALEQQVEELAKNIHQHLSNALPKRDFHLSDAESENFGAGKLPLEEVIRQLDAEPQSQIVDAAVLRRKIELLNDLKALLWAMREGPTGSGRARYALLLSDDESMNWTDDYPFNAFTSPVVLHRSGSASERLLGILKGQVRQVLDHVRLIRRAALEIKNKYRPELHGEEIGTLEWASLSPSEKDFLPPMLLLGDTRLFSGQGQRTLFELLSSGLPVKVIILDDAALPVGSTANALLSAAQIGWASGTTLHHIFTLKDKLGENPAVFEQLRDGLNRPEPALFHLLAPKPEQHNEQETFWAERSTFAIQTRAFTSLLFDPDEEKGFLSTGISLEGNPEKEADWVRTMLIFKEGEEKKEQSYTLTYADWLFSLKAWQRCFQPFEPESGSPLSIAEYLALDEKGQKGKVPTVSAVDEQGLLKQYIAAPEVVAATRQVLRQWNTLKELAGLRSPFPQKVKKELEKELTQKHEQELKVLKATYETKLQEQEQAFMKQVKAKLSDKLLALSRQEKPLSPLKE